MIGRTPDGTKLPFGPYTLIQMCVAAVTVVLLWNTVGLWARFGLIANLVAAAGLLFGAVWAAGRLPPGLRNPLVVVGGWLHAAERALGTGGPLVRLPKPRVARGQVSMFTDDETADVVPIEDPPHPARHQPGTELPSAAVGLPVLTGVQLLLAQTTPH